MAVCCTEYTSRDFRSVFHADRNIEEIMTDKNIVEVAVEAGTFTTLAAALGAADLVATLQSE